MRKFIMFITAVCVLFLIYLKCLEKVIFYFRWNWQVQLLDFTLVRVVLGYFENFNSNEPFTYKRCMNCSSLPWQRKLFVFSFSLVCGFAYPPRIFKTFFLRI